MKRYEYCPDCDDGLNYCFNYSAYRNDECDDAHDCAKEGTDCASTCKTCLGEIMLEVEVSPLELLAEQAE
jgi:hypothetical protein